jgi:hypothetical protein
MKYYVLSQGEEPIKLFFNEATAFADGAEWSNAYLDVFNEEGNKVESFKLEYNSDNDSFVWTKDF